MAPPARRIGYVTDVEGNLAYFERYVRASGILEFDGGGDLAFADDGCAFVFGGDVVDKGRGDLRLCRLLCGLYDRYGPGRVALLVGNRDLNKLRLTGELGPRALARRPEAVPPPHWDDAAPRYAAWLGDRGDGEANRLKWILEHTLGCGGTFEHRRAELDDLRGGGAIGGAIGDAAVVASFRSYAAPGGDLRAYLDRGSVAARMGDTLFVHGAVDRLTAGFVPDAATRFRVGRPGDAGHPSTKTFYDVRGVDAWVSGLNALLAAGLAAHAADPDGYGDERAGACLLAIQNRCAVWGRSVVSNCYADGGNVDTPSAARRRERTWAAVAGAADDARAFEASTKYASDARDPAVHAWLRASGVRRVVVGHKPCGAVPAVLAAAPGGAEIVNGDTSYADRDAPDGRGVSLAAIAIVDAAGGGSRTTVRGTTADGAAYAIDMPVLGGRAAGDAASADDDAAPALGTVDADGWWCKARVGDASLLSRGDGRAVETRLVPR